jgi:hypothetical protein
MVSKGSGSPNWCASVEMSTLWASANRLAPANWSHREADKFDVLGGTPFLITPYRYHPPPLALDHKASFGAMSRRSLWRRRTSFARLNRDRASDGKPASSHHQQAKDVHRSSRSIHASECGRRVSRTLMTTPVDSFSGEIRRSLKSRAKKAWQAACSTRGDAEALRVRAQEP